MQISFLDTLLGVFIYLFTTLEGWSFIFSLIFVVLSIKKNTYSWLFAIISSVLYGFVCWQNKLYLTAYLQGFFILTSIYGFIQWDKNSINKNNLQQKWQATHLNKNGFILITSLALVLFGIISAIFAIFTKVGNMMYIESLAASLSLVAQFLSAKRCMQNWLFWLIINIMYVAVNFHQHLYLMALLYLIFSILSIDGYMKWKKTEKNQRLESMEIA